MPTSSLRDTIAGPPGNARAKILDLLALIITLEACIEARIEKILEAKAEALIARAVKDYLRPN